MGSRDKRMDVKPIIDKKIWDTWVAARKEHSFLQSWIWGECNTELGDEALRVGLFDGERIVAVAQVLTIHARRGTFYFIPHGPVCDEVATSDEKALFQIFETLVQYLRKEAQTESKKQKRRERISFIRFSPQLIDNPVLQSVFRKLSLRPAPMHMHAERSWLLDITPPEKTLLTNMRKANRYNIKKAEREGVIVTQGKNKNDIEQFHQLFETFAEKKSFVAFSKNYVLSEYEHFARDNNILLFIARHGDNILAMAMIIFSGSTAFYHQSLSTGLSPEKQGSYLMLWEAIREAKKRGCVTFNFWGIAPQGDRKHPWAGLTFFKTGFGGYERNYIHAHDLPLTQRYWVNYIIESVRRIKRGF
ncbi:MAG: hypothetical protein A2666_04970 [Parcubacteria group bacterium RIFCSPHIGHO2_01_FULL_47_10b]|nr:MAG: hypothetical protein A2666_04970 [Parcubacteria group bacterium RIFCSPHIGHO2_01_FULL_47_10b]